MAYSLAFPPGYSFLDDDGAPVSGGFLYVYAAGTSTPATTYSDHTASTPHQNPAPLDAGGRLQDGGMYIPEGSYKFILTDAEALEKWTQDNVSYADPF